VLFSHGVPGALFYVGWFAYVAWISRRGGSWATFWSHVTLVIVLLQLPYYGMLPSQIHVVMLASAIALRERRAFTEAVEATATAGERAPAAAGAG